MQISKKKLSLFSYFNKKKNCNSYFNEYVILLFPSPSISIAVTIPTAVSILLFSVTFFVDVIVLLINSGALSLTSIIDIGIIAKREEINKSQY